ncbi:MAG: insulinase family protein, partial [Candidatus Fermentibacteria bacterium]|nr:insulinase family protein [Candidatus Fermentibacteria bacterium]
MSRVMLIVVVVCFSFAFAEEPLVTVLDNGLTVITQELHYAPVVASVISYRVGSRNEVGDILGMSHFLEHQMFKGTPDMPPGRFWQIVQRDGGNGNAFTSNDVTCYYLILPASRIEDALSIESDRMVNCLIDSLEVISERNVVHEERRMRSIDSPDGALREALAEISYTEHPYGLPVIGYDENILAYNAETTRAYYETYYAPSNAVLTMVGDFETEELLAKIESYFGEIPAGNVPEEAIPVEPIQTEARYVEIEHASNLPRFVMAFHSVDGADPAAPAMSMISSYLSSGRASRLDQLLVETKMVYGVGAWDEGGIDPGMFNISVTMNSPEQCEVTIEEVQNIIWNELEYISENGISEEILEELKNKYRASEILGDANPVGLALGYSLSTTMFGDPLYSRNQLELVEQLTSEDIREAASTCFRRNGVNIAVLSPAGGRGGMGGGGNQQLPTDVTEPSSVNYDGLVIPEDFLVPPTSSIADGVETFELENGLVLLVKEDHTFPVASINFSVPMGSFMHSSELNGLTSTTTETMLNGTEELEYREFHRRL